MKEAKSGSLDRVLAVSSGESPDEARVYPSEQLPTVGSVMQAIGSEARQRIKPWFDRADISYPPRKVSLIFIKDIARLELWASDSGKPALVGRFPFKAESREFGPKLDRNDGLIPEGTYRVTGLNPDRAGYLAMKLNYPNLLDLKYANRDGRKPAGDVCIQAGHPQDGCIAISETVSEALFVLLADVGLSSVTVLISPSDPRVVALNPPVSPLWVGDLYRKITDSFSPYGGLTQSFTRST